MIKPTYHYDQGASIEGLRTKFQAGKIVPANPERDPILNCTLYCFTLDKAKIHITRALKPKKPLRYPSSFVDVGDGLEGNKIRVLTRKQITRPKLRPGTSSHRARFARTRAYTLANIWICYDPLPLKPREAQALSPAA